MVILAAGFMYFVEFFADKVPGVDSGWDALHTFIRIPAGALLAAGAVGDMNAALVLAAAIVGGGLAAGVHATKAGTRVLINTSPEPFTNWTASVLEDLMVIGGLWTALHHPVLFLLLLIGFIALMIWLLPKLWRGIKKVFGYLGRLFGRKPPGPMHRALAMPLIPGREPADDLTAVTKNVRIPTNSVQCSGTAHTVRRGLPGILGPKAGEDLGAWLR